MEKSFSLDMPQKTEGTPYRTKILTIINDLERKARYVDPDEMLHKELHEKKLIDSRNEKKEYESVRADICETFGVPNDQEHVYIYTPPESMLNPIHQRALRAFFVLIDVGGKNSFYGEGRINHNLLMGRLANLLGQQDGTSNEDTVIDGINQTPPKYLMFKGFLSTKDFREITDSSRQVLETPLLDASGAKIETPPDWFLTGHNLDDLSSIKSSS